MGNAIGESREGGTGLKRQEAGG